jgi:dTDP-4-amino-4,6-dideoxygalactose transaminase
MEPIAFFDPKPINHPHYAEFEATFHDFIRSGHYILGEAVEQFETHFAKANGNAYAIGVSSGTDALLVALLALGLKPNDEVLCPSFTFFATASCVVRLGAIPVWVDVHPEDFTIDLDDASNKCS